MQLWLVYGLLAAFFFGISTIAAKIATSEKFYGINPMHVSLLILLGIAVDFVVSSLLQGSIVLPKSPLGIVFGGAGRRLVGSWHGFRPKGSLKRR